MPQFVMIGWDGADGSALRDQHRDGHLAHVHALRSSGQIVFAGPIKDESGTASIGAIIIFETADLKEAQALMDRDPYVVGGVFKTLTLNPFKQVIPETA